MSLQLEGSAPPLVGAQVVKVNGKEVLGMTLEEVMDVMREATAPGHTFTNTRHHCEARPVASPLPILSKSFFLFFCKGVLYRKKGKKKALFFVN